MKAYFPTKTQREDRKVFFGAFDFETRGLGGELLLATWYIENMDEAQVIYGTPDEIVENIVKVFIEYPKIRWYAHNAQYDWRYLVDYLIDKFSDSLEFLMRTDNDVFLISTKYFELVDSFAIWPHSLKKLGEQFCPDLPKLEIDIENFDVNNPIHIEYAKRDSELLVKALIEYDHTIYNIFGCHLRYTIAATALLAWKMTIKNPYFKQDKIDKFVRKAYYGGPVGLSTTKLIDQVCYSFDINSSYPFSMREFGVPYGPYAKINYYENSVPGIHNIILKTPDNLVIPIIPKRITKGKSDYIVWPKGLFETTVTNIELDFALQHGYEIIEYKEGIIFSETIYPFNDFVNICEDTRSYYKDTPTEVVVKLIQNSLYGKFGTRPERSKIFIIKDESEKIGAIQWGDSGKLFIKKETTDIMALPQWAAFITANARIYLFDNIYKHGIEYVLYYDTDSIITTKVLDNNLIGNKYGKFKHEKTWEKFRAIAPKIYSGKQLGLFSGKAKGMKNLKEDDYKDLLEKSIVTCDIEILPSLKQYMNEKRETKHITRKSTNIKNSRSWKISEITNDIEPIELNEL